MNKETRKWLTGVLLIVLGFYYKWCSSAALNNDDLILSSIYLIVELSCLVLGTHLITKSIENKDV